MQPWTRNRQRLLRVCFGRASVGFYLEGNSRSACCEEFGQGKPCGVSYYIPALCLYVPSGHPRHKIHVTVTEEALRYRARRYRKPKGRVWKIAWVMRNHPPTRFSISHGGIIPEYAEQHHTSRRQTSQPHCYKGLQVTQQTECMMTRLFCLHWESISCRPPIIPFAHDSQTPFPKHLLQALSSGIPALHTHRRPQHLMVLLTRSFRSLSSCIIQESSASRKYIGDPCNLLFLQGALHKCEMSSACMQLTM